MNLCCEVVMDLLPLYIDGLASEESGALVKEHLRICPSCRKYYRNYHKITAVDVLEPEAGGRSADSEKYHQLSARMRKRQIISTAALLSIVTLSVAGALVSVFVPREKEKK